MRYLFLIDNIAGYDHILSLDFSKTGSIGQKMPYNLRLTYSYDYLLSDYHYLLQRHTIRPVFILQENPTHLNILQYALQIKEFREKPLFPEDNRDAVNHEAGFTHFLRFNEAKHYLKAGYFYDKEFAQGDNWDYSGNKFVTGFQYTFPNDIRLNVDYEYKQVRYKNTNIYFDEKRRDIERGLMTALSKDIGKGWGVSLEYLRRRNSSNIEFILYRKSLFSRGELEMVKELFILRLPLFQLGDFQWRY